jgi:hypothetical protein
MYVRNMKFYTILSDHAKFWNLRSSRKIGTSEMLQLRCHNTLKFGDDDEFPRYNIKLDVLMQILF